MFNDGTTCGTKTTNPSNFNEVKIHPEGSIVRKIRIQYIEHSTAMGLFSGVEFFDAQGTRILKAGRVNEQMPWFKFLEVKIDENERIVGVKSGKRDGVIAHHYDL